MELPLVLCSPQASKTQGWIQELSGKLDKAAGNPDGFITRRPIVQTYPSLFMETTDERQYWPVDQNSPQIFSVYLIMKLVKLYSNDKHFINLCQ